ncbi:MAG: lipoyl synthase [Candidatus Makana argininalis]
MNKKKYLYQKNNINSSKIIPINIVGNKKKKYKLKKPYWIKNKLPINNKLINKIKKIINKYNLNSVCKEASCPNLYECFNSGTVSFMILGNLCTRNCPFCNVNHGRPIYKNYKEPFNLAKAIKEMKLKYVVITSVNRDDLRDGGSKHFVKCIKIIRKTNVKIKIEILVPDFKNCINIALNTINLHTPDIFNHNIENVPRLYKKIRPGANYFTSLNLLEKFKFFNPNIQTKSGLMIGLGETISEIFKVMTDLINCGVNMITIGQYLQPTSNHLPVKKYISLKEFEYIKNEALKMGFSNVYCGPFVRSSYHADLQSKNLLN